MQALGSKLLYWSFGRFKNSCSKFKKISIPFLVQKPSSPWAFLTLYASLLPCTYHPLYVTTGITCWICEKWEIKVSPFGRSGISWEIRCYLFPAHGGFSFIRWANWNNTTKSYWTRRTSNLLRVRAWERCQSIRKAFPYVKIALRIYKTEDFLPKPVPSKKLWFEEDIETWNQVRLAMDYLSSEVDRKSERL